MLTRSNIAYDLNISPHKATIIYKDHEICYVFSSELYKRKFFEKMKENRDTISKSLSNRFGFSISNELLSDLKLYTTVEKRGFLLFKNGDKIVCQDSIILDGETLTRKP